MVGAGMTKFERPMTRSWDYPDMGREAGQSVVELALLVLLLAFPVSNVW